MYPYSPSVRLELPAAVMDLHSLEVFRENLILPFSSLSNLAAISSGVQKSTWRFGQSNGLAVD